MFRGMSEVSAQLRQIRLRQITTKIGTRLYRASATQSAEDLRPAVYDIVAELSRWRDAFPILLEPRNPYETIQWRDLNYFRECLKCYRLLILTGREKSAATSNNNGGSIIECFHLCHEAAFQVAALYQAFRATDKLILNWTCVHDMMSAGFTTLYCGIAQRQMARTAGRSPPAWGVDLSAQSAQLEATTSVIIDTLSYIAQRWPTVKRHVRVFQDLAARVAESARSTNLDACARDETMAGHQPAEIADSGLPSAFLPTGVPGWENSHVGNADVWDAAMAQFLDEPLELSNIDWGAIDWSAMQLVSDGYQSPVRR